jgi:hypothetical protein
MQEVATHAAAQRYEEAAAVRDDAMRLRNAVIKHRRTEALRGTGRLVLEICGEGTVELQDGVFVESGRLVPEAMVPDSSGLVSASSGATDEDQDRDVAAQWLHLNAALVRVVHSERPLCWPAARIPELTDLASLSAPRLSRDVQSTEGARVRPAYESSGLPRTVRSDGGDDPSTSTTP